MKASYAKMEKAILLNLKPEQVEKILNKEKTLELRNSVPKNFTGWVYIYVRKAKKRAEELSYQPFGMHHPLGVRYDKKNCWQLNKCGSYTKEYAVNGKVVARFWFDKDKVLLDEHGYYNWSITRLEIFDEPKELSEFYIYANFSEATWRTLNYEGFKEWAFIKKAPPNWKSVYVESEIKE